MFDRNFFRQYYSCVAKVVKGSMPVWGIVYCSLQLIFLHRCSAFCKTQGTKKQIHDASLI